MRQIVMMLVLSALVSVANAQSKGKAHDLRRNADQQYDRKAYDQAEESYRKATILDPDDKGTFNLGNAIFNQNRYEEAARQYEKAAEMIESKGERSRAWYNLGNAHYLNGKFDQSVEAFKKALRDNPEDLEAKQNLLMALQELKMQQQQQQQQNQQEQEEQEDQDQQQQQQPSPQDQNQDQENQQQDAQSEDQNQTEPEQLEQKLTKDQAMQLLEIIDEEDKKVQEKLRKVQSKEKKAAKDW